LAVGGLGRFAAVTDTDYNPIRQMAESIINGMPINRNKP